MNPLALALAKAILADPRKTFTLSADDTVRVCQALVDAHDNPQPVITDELAEAARALITAAESVAQAKQPDGTVPLGIGHAREHAFHTFQTLFELEFPNE